MSTPSPRQARRPAAPRHPFLDHPGPLAFAHRGGAADGLENTVTAFRRAVDLGYRYLETDVHATADGVLVACHDATLDRVTDATGAVASLPWRQVRRARVAGREPLPRFEELLEEFPRARFNVDVKAPAAVEPLVAAIGRTGAWDRVCVGSFSQGRVARARALAGDRLATSLGTRGVAALRLLSYGGRALSSLGVRTAVCVQVPEYHAGVRVVDATFLRAAHRRGLQVHVWTVNDPARMAALLDLGVDGIITDDIDALRTLLVERGAWPPADWSTGPTPPPRRPIGAPDLQPPRRPKAVDRPRAPTPPHAA
ncbi:putative phosphodiesterase [Streptantibioticus cattleyicolor NRRL 8057 = DSM 46488]|uniref:Putative phosphodiesterase n=1 Tax=Streptantibioticus cattleyicolor (strain ATCC 35852 / DSM 46488 / JCM 4925 / NBRC 14057 / NRRL 8057) TaxID=1003195 RepID=F8JPJ9_STREN|nr:putative phosphodiesterase [Streptantibioticus cattleyicolor NRRL 8057 = DSM 46488]MYS62188.1 glycerophosphodiester phosphodiesterase [Streptomyces sp. SID5468]CCB78086.1 putative phosphodiesterase [Streptantibioticus cattleyicolor NRRL 8057 = DSM 46488]